MNEEPKSLWTKFVEQPRRFFLTLALGTLVLLALCFVAGNLLRHVNPSPGWRSVAAFVLVGLSLGFIAGFCGFFLALIPPLQPLFRWIVRRSAFLLACLVTLVALFYALENFRGKRAWENFKREANARGEGVEVKDIIPPPVPDEQNVVATPLFKDLCNEFDREWRDLHTGPGGLTNAADRLKFNIGRESQPWPEKESANWMLGRRTDLKAWQDYYRNPTNGTQPSSGGPADDFPIAAQAQTPAADVLLALSKYDALLEELRVAAARPRARFPLYYEAGFSVLLPHLARLKGITQFLRLRAAAELEAGQINEAAADVELSLRLVDLVREEPVLISQLVRIAQLQLALTPLWEGLADHRWTEAQLAGFERRLNQFDFLADYQRGMRGERACCTWTIDYVRRLRNPDMVGLGSDQTVAGRDEIDRLLGPLVMQLIPRGWFDQNKVSVGRMHLELLLPAVDHEARRVSPSNVNRLAESLNRRVQLLSPYNWLGMFLLPAPGGASARFAQAQVSVDLARVACALERHRLAHGQYPETLDALAPQFLPKLPHDLINGQPLQYRRADDGSFTLYSVGWNEKDDGGTVALVKDKHTADWKQGDWVWRYPAK